MKIIVGLGNPGDKYKGTRHNMGFGVLDELADKLNISINQKEHKGLTGKGFFAGEKLILVKPQTFMNNSGECVGPLATYYGVEPKDVIVVYDDICLEPGHLRIRAKGSAGGHNGMKSLIAHLHSEEFPRVRVGVGAKPENCDLAAWVLARFPQVEQENARKGIENGARAVQVLLTEGVDAAMNLFNGM